MSRVDPVPVALVTGGGGGSEPRSHDGWHRTA